eukprot:3020871-Pyramimonas_sp.AAC.1
MVAAQNPVLDAVEAIGAAVDAIGGVIVEVDALVQVLRRAQLMLHPHHGQYPQPVPSLRTHDGIHNTMDGIHNTMDGIHNRSRRSEPAHLSM